MRTIAGKTFDGTSAQANACLILLVREHEHGHPYEILARENVLCFRAREMHDAPIQRGSHAGMAVRQSSTWGWAEWNASDWTFGG